MQTRVFCGTIPVGVPGLTGRIAWCDCPRSSLHFGRANATHRHEYVDWMRQEHERSIRERCIHQQMLLGAVAAAVGVNFIDSDVQFPGSVLGSANVCTHIPFRRCRTADSST